MWRFISGMYGGRNSLKQYYGVEGVIYQLKLSGDGFSIFIFAGKFIQAWSV